MKKKMCKLLFFVSMVIILAMTCGTFRFANVNLPDQQDEDVFYADKTVFVSDPAFMEPSEEDVLVGSGFISEDDIISSLQKRSGEELLSQRYSESVISELRKTDAEAAANAEDAAGVTSNGIDYKVYLTAGQFYYNSSADITNLTAYILWEWRSKPKHYLSSTGVVAMRTDNSNFIVKNAVTTVNYNYAAAGTSAGSQTVTPYTYGCKTGSYVTFPLKEPDNAAEAAYAKSGRISINWVAGEDIRVVAFSCSYGHAKTALTPVVLIEGMYS